MRASRHSGARSRHHAGLTASLSVLALVAVACGSSGKSQSASPTTSSTAASVECATGTISGAGSTFVQNLAQQWIKDFDNACPGATVNYQGVGSGAGIQQLIAGTVDFAGTDVPMKPDEQQQAEAKGGPMLHIPWSAGGIAIEYKVTGVSSLNLSPETLAGIFAGKIAKWDDPKVKADNAGTSLPSEGIQVVHRSDGSGTTAVLTAYMTAAAPGIWTAGTGKDVPWPVGQGAKGSDGVTAAVKAAEGAIGYAEVSFAKGAGLSYAQIKNGGGQFVGPTTAAVQAALAAATVPPDLKVKISYLAPDPAVYPISTTTFVVVPQKPADAAKGKLLRAFLRYALGKGQDSAETLRYASLPKDLLTKDLAAVDSMQVS
jgi:phosphate transport system substrate-binding protein